MSRRSNRLPVLLVSTLAILTSMVLWQLVTLDTHVVPAASPQETAASKTAVSFYGAVNSYLESGESAPLESLLHDQYRDYATGAVPDETAAGLIRYLDIIRASAPDFRLSTGEIDADGDLVTVQLEAVSRQELTIGKMDLNLSPIWSAVDTLRIENGLVTERRSANAAPVLVEPNAIDVEFTTATGWHSSVFERWSIEPFVSDDWLDVSVPLLVIAEQGSVSLQIDPPKGERVTHAVRGTGSSPVESMSDIEIHEQESLIFPSGSRFLIADVSGEEASLVTFYLRPHVLLSRGQSGPRVEGPRKGVRREVIGTGSPVDFGGQIEVSTATAFLEPGAVIPARETTGIEFVVVSRGTVEVSAPVESVWRIDWKKTSPPEDGKFLLETGRALIVEPGVPIEYKSGSNIESVATIVSVTN